jgi:hypothetical protein
MGGPFNRTAKLREALFMDSGHSLRQLLDEIARANVDIEQGGLHASMTREPRNFVYVPSCPCKIR